MKEKKIKEVIVPVDAISGWHRVLYRPSQVERCFPCYGIKPKIGLRLAMLFPHDEFLATKGAVPKAKFFVGKIVRMMDDSDLVEIKFDGNPYAPLGITLAWSAYEKFCIPYPAKRGAKPHNRARDGRDRSKR